MTRTGLGWLFVLVAALLGSACGDDSGGGDGGAPEPMGEPCQVGLPDTNCSCDDGRSGGVRYCSSDGFWGDCMCRPVNDAGQPVCREGQRVICNPCGNSDRWETTCDANGNYNCACDSPDAPRNDAGR